MNSMAEKVSVLIPAYNASKYIEQCLDSVYAQDYKNFEVIVSYDTKSTDDTLEILQKYLEKHPLMIDIGQDSGSGAARNRGFSLSTGEYIVYVDADDELLPEYLSTMIDMFHEHPEINAVCCNFVKVDDGNIGRVRDTVRTSPDIRYLCTRDEALKRKLSPNGKSRMFHNYSWLWMIKRSFLTNHNIKYPNYSYWEDHVYSWKVVGYSDTIYVTDKILYLYRQNRYSLAHSKPKNYLELLKTPTKEIHEFLKEVYPAILPEYDEFHEEFLKATQIFYAIQHYDYKTYRNDMKTSNIHHVNPNIYRGMNTSGIILMYFFNISPAFAYFICRFYLRISNNYYTENRTQ